MRTSRRRLVLLVNLGTPAEATASAVHAFLEEFLSDPSVVDYPGWLWQPVLSRLILRSRPAHVAAMYRSIATRQGMPLDVDTRRLAATLQAAAGISARVRFAYRYGSRSLAAEIARARNEGVDDVVVVPLFPQRTSASSETIVEQALRAAAELGFEAAVRVERIAPADPGYVAALVARVREAFQTMASKPQHLVVSFHGIPVRYDWREKGRYQADCAATVSALLAALDWPASNATLSYQSQFGPEPWIGPNTASVLARLPAKGARRVAVVMPGFLTEGLETLEEIGIRGRDTFLGAGGEQFVAVPAVGTHPALVESLCAIIDQNETAREEPTSAGGARGGPNRVTVRIGQ